MGPGSRTLPTFLIIGAAKAGTTTLYDVLKQHPGVYLSFAKEPMFFSHDENFRRGPEWYAATFFPDAGSFRARGEATPHYLYWSDKVAPRVRDVYGDADVKFIAIFRDPVERAYSWYWNMVREGREDLPFEAALEREEQRLGAAWASLRDAGSMVHGYFRGGCYAAQLEIFLEQFPRERFLFLLQEDLAAAFAPTMRTVCEFLGVNERLPLRPARGNPAALPRSRRVQRLLQGPSLLKHTFKALVPRRARYRLKGGLLRANLRKARYPPLDARTARALRARYDGEIRRLAALIDRDLSHWREA